MNLETQQIHSSVQWQPIAKYRNLVAGPGTVYQDCGDVLDTVTVANGELAWVKTVDGVDTVVKHTVLPRYDLFLAPAAAPRFEVQHLRLRKQAVVLYQSSVNATAELGKLSGDGTGTLDIMPQSTVILGNYHSMQEPTQIMSTTQLINPLEMIVTKKTRYYVNDIADVDSNIQVRENAKLVVPGNISFSGGASVVIAGHLLGAETMIVHDDAHVYFQKTAQHTNSLSEHDANKVGRFTSSR
jgi:hypothetical protein